MPVLSTNRESSHSCKAAPALSLMGIPFEQRSVDLNLPRASAPATWPAIGAWLERIRSLPRWQAPYDLLLARPLIATGTRT